MDFKRKALIDNATLTGVQRLLGHIKVKNTYNIEGDVLCMENLIQCILFYDEIIFYDDYKDEYKDVRAKVFQFLQPVNLDKSTNALAEKRATDIWNQIPLKIQNGRIKNETINEYLKLILLNLSFTWDMSSSLYYLTVKTLGDVNNVQLIDKNSALFAMIKTALTEKSRIQPDNFNEEIQILN